MFKKGDRTKTILFLTLGGIICAIISTFPSVSRFITVSIVTKDMEKVPTEYVQKFDLKETEDILYYYDKENDIWEIEIKDDTLTIFAGAEKRNTNQKYDAMSDSDTDVVEVTKDG
jgi:hypothetical protein